MSDAATPARFAENIVHFGRLLRAAGLPVGSGQIANAIAAVELAGVGRRDDFQACLHANFVTRGSQRPLFDQAFHMFWRNPKLLEKMVGLLLPRVEGLAADNPATSLPNRLADAFFPDAGAQTARQRDAAPEDIEIVAAFGASASERLQTLDFETMSVAELAEAKAALARLRFDLRENPTRRFYPDPAGARLDLRATLRRSLRGDPSFIALRRRSARTRPPPLVVLCDISGSMGRYSRMLLHFLHTLLNRRERVSVFLFGTRLTNVTRALRGRDVDEAVDRVTAAAPDWSGGTRIGHALREFNRLWSRRVLAQGAVVLLISDGLEADGSQYLRAETERLRLSCRRLIWLNPLLRWDRFEPKAAGIRAILPFVDEFRPCHSLRNLHDLADALSAPLRNVRKYG